MSDATFGRLTGEISTGDTVGVADGGLSTLDRIFKTLADQRRRDALYCLLQREPVSLDELATHVAANARDTSPDRLTADERETVLIDLYHHHLLRLADAGVVEYDSRSGVIRCRHVPPLLLKYLSFTASVERSTVPQVLSESAPSHPTLVEPVPVSLDTLFTLLENPHRRYILAYLREYTHPVSLDELATQLSKWEYDVPSSSVADEQRKHFRVVLYHRHAPKMEDAGLLDFDPESEHLALSEQGRSLGPLIDCICADDDFQIR